MKFKVDNIKANHVEAPHNHLMNVDTKLFVFGMKSKNT